ncbi:uncharacterized protein GGS25DRAFT_495116 [Hypoxylon fragiforme]|uniref:uncharacterized protein n=1 Tax=Hypoxylon fragiforme TaxID=63214 RepID=UPI0020C5DA2F|nr:uncharacterized protein GGS25DRAFT_495116 [Hypoxylon fragiforme]KAI2607282.1 hypothetical protein GGS25DRAFT_495116 [Hypoxylon fragiforme]
MPPTRLPRGFAHDVLLSELSPRSQPSTTSVTTSATLVRKLHNFASRRLLPRLATGVSTVPEGYGRTPSGPSPGAVVGIVLGSVAGFVLLLLLIYWCVNLGTSAPQTVIEGSVGTGPSSSVVSYRSRPRVHRHTHRSSRQYSPHRRKETVEIVRRERDMRRSLSRASTPPRAPDLDQIVVVEEHDRSTIPRSRSRSRSASRPRPPRAPPAPPIDDEIIVLEEHSPPRRRESRSYRRRSSERRSERRSSGGQYRDVDPHRYAGGDGPSRDVSRRSSSRR